MRGGSRFGGWGHGSPGDPDPDDVLPVFDALLVPDVAEAMLDGESWGAPFPVELRPLEEVIAALRAAPSAAEFRGEARVMTAFRALHGRNGTEVNGAALANAGAAHTLPLEIPREGAGRRSRRTRHRAPAGARPSAGPVLRRRVAQTSAAAAGLVVVLGITAYSGYLPGPLQNAAHRMIDAPSARTTPPGRSPGLTGGPGSLNGSATPATPATSETPPWTGTTPTGQPRTIAQVCEAYYANRQGDQSDYRKLIKAAGGPEHVQAYCQVHIRRGHGKPVQGSTGSGQDGNSQGNSTGDSNSGQTSGSNSGDSNAGQSNGSGSSNAGQSNGSSGGSSGHGR